MAFEQLGLDSSAPGLSVTWKRGARTGNEAEAWARSLSLGAPDCMDSPTCDASSLVLLEETFLDTTWQRSGRPMARLLPLDELELVRCVEAEGLRCSEMGD